MQLCVCVFSFIFICILLAGFFPYFFGVFLPILLLSLSFCVLFFLVFLSDCLSSLLSTIYETLSSFFFCYIHFPLSCCFCLCLWYTKYKKKIFYVSFHLFCSGLKRNIFCIWNNDTHLFSPMIWTSFCFCIIWHSFIFYFYSVFHFWSFAFSSSFIFLFHSNHISYCVFYFILKLLRQNSKPLLRNSTYAKITYLVCWNGLDKSSRKSPPLADQRNTSTNYVIKSICSR